MVFGLDYNEILANWLQILMNLEQLTMIQVKSIEPIGLNGFAQASL